RRRAPRAVVVAGARLSVLAAGRPRHRGHPALTRGVASVAGVAAEDGRPRRSLGPGRAPLHVVEARAIALVELLAATEEGSLDAAGEDLVAPLTIRDVARLPVEPAIGRRDQ